MVSETVIDLSRWQFAIHAVQHFWCLPLTLGLSLLLVLMESCYVFGGQVHYQRLAQFWGKLFTLALGLSLMSSLIMLCQFGTHWAYLAHYVGDVVALPLLISVFGLFVVVNWLGLWLFAWQRLGKFAHWLLTCLISIASHGVWGAWLTLESWMKQPLAAEFNPQALRMEAIDLQWAFSEPALVSDFATSLLTGYSMAAGLLLSISAYQLLKQRDVAMAMRGYRLAVAVGLFSAALAFAWTEGSGSPAHVLAQSPVLSADELRAQSRQRVLHGIEAYGLLQELRDDKREPALLEAFAAARGDLGYGLLLRQWKDSVVDAKPVQIEQAVSASLAPQTVWFWGQKVARVCGGLSLLVFLIMAVGSVLRRQSLGLMTLGLYALPLPWLAAIASGLGASLVRQPWVVSDILPTWLGVSLLTTSDLIISLLVYGLVYAGMIGLAVILALKIVAQASSEEVGHVA